MLRLTGDTFPLTSSGTLSVSWFSILMTAAVEMVMVVAAVVVVAGGVVCKIATGGATAATDGGCTG